MATVEPADTIMTRMEAEGTKSIDLVTQFMQRQQAAVDEASKLVDPVERKKKLDVLNAQFKEIRAEAEGDKTDLATIVGAFIAQEQKLDVEFDALENASPAEKARIDEKERAVKAAEVDVDKAKGAWTFGGMRDPVGTANAALAVAKAELEKVKTDVASGMQSRILNANPEQSLVTLQLRGERTLRNLDTKKKELTIQLGIASLGRAESYKLAEDADKQIRVLDEQIKTAEAQINANADRLERLTESDPDYTKLQSETADLKQKLEATKNAHQRAFATKNEVTKDALEYGGSELALTQLIGAIDTMMRVTEVKNRNMPKKRDIYTKVLKGGAVQEISKNLADVGDAAQLRMMQRTVRVGQAAVNSRQDFFKSQPGRIAERKDIRLAQEQAQITSLREDEKIRAALIEAGVDIDRIFAGEHGMPPAEEAAPAA